MSEIWSVGEGLEEGGASAGEEVDAGEEVGLERKAALERKVTLEKKSMLINRRRSRSLRLIP